MFRLQARLLSLGKPTMGGAASGLSGGQRPEKDNHLISATRFHKGLILGNKTAAGFGFIGCAGTIVGFS